MTPKEECVRLIYNLGFYPALDVLFKLEEKEEFEKCEVLKSAMEQVGNGRWWYLSTNTDKETRKEVLENTLIGHSEVLRNNMATYCQRFKEEINKIEWTR